PLRAGEAEGVLALVGREAALREAGVPVQHAPDPAHLRQVDTESHDPPGAHSSGWAWCAGRRTGILIGSAHWGRTLTEDMGVMERNLNDLVPGGAHTYAKGDDQYPVGAPIIARGEGARVWDTEGNEYVEYGSGLRSVSLGHAHPEVNAAVKEAIDKGLNFVRPALLEVEAAEDFLSTVPGADMVKFAKN